MKLYPIPRYITEVYRYAIIEDLNGICDIYKNLPEAIDSILEDSKEMEKYRRVRFLGECCPFKIRRTAQLYVYQGDLRFIKRLFTERSKVKEKLSKSPAKRNLAIVVLGD